MPLREPVLLNTDLEDILEIGNSDLVEMCLTGDKEALNLFYTRFAPRMMGVIRRYVPNMDDDRVGQGHYCPFPPSEPYMRVSPHTAQAFLSLCSFAETGSDYSLLTLDLRDNLKHSS